MLMIFAVLLRYISSKQKISLQNSGLNETRIGISEVRVRVPFRPEIFRVIFRYCLTSVAKRNRVHRFSRFFFFYSLFFYNNKKVWYIKFPHATQ